MIVLGPGCLHLVKSEGVTVQSAWNIMVKGNYLFYNGGKRI